MRRASQILFGVVLVASLTAQEPAEKKALRAQDYGQWESLRGSGVLSDNGRWLAYPIRRSNGKNELRLRMLVTDAKEVFPYATGARFSADSLWLGYLVGVSEEEREKLEKAKKPVRNDFALRNLTDGETLEVEDVAGFSFSEDGKHVAMRRYTKKGAKTKGADLVVRRLATGEQVCFGNVSSHSWCEKTSLLAMIIDTEDEVGNGVTVYDADSGNVRSLASDKARYSTLSWREDAADLAFLRIQKHDEKKDEEPTHTLIAWRGLDEGRGRRFTYDPLGDEGFPDGMRIVTYGGLRWHDEGRAVFFGIREWKRPPGKDEDGKTKPARPEQVVAAGEKTIEGDEAAEGTLEKGVEKVAAAEDEKPVAEKKGAKKEEPARSLRESLKDPAGVDVWNARDVNIIPRQKKTASQDRRRNHLCVYWLDAGRFVRLGDETADRVVVLEKGRHALGRDTTRHERIGMFGPRLSDVYIIDTKDGGRRRLLEQHKYAYGSSPDGRWLTYVKGGYWWLYDIEKDVHRNLTRRIGGSEKFINMERGTLTDEPSPYGLAGWSKDSQRLLLYDRYDIWAFSVQDPAAWRITQGAEEKTRYRLLDLDPDEDFIDDTADIYLSVYGDTTKRSGFARLAPDGAVKTLVMKDAKLGGLAKAEGADVYVYTEQRFDDSPDVFVAGPDLEKPRQVTETNPFQGDYHWGRGELVDYVNTEGVPLQGALTYPAGYEKGKRYPMIVYIYEKRSQNLHNYYAPSERSAYNPAVFSSLGYFVYQPDIVYRPQNPGVSALECVVPAVEKVLERGDVDPKRVGLVGHSWGAYQTAFIVSRSNVFAAGIAGAPLTNMMSMSMSIYWNTGGTDARIFHESQGRMDRPFWQDVDTYIANSPIFGMDTLNTPLLIAFGDKDGAVDWHQGIEMYNAARLADKKLVMLVYEGENHGLRKKPNQVDYHWRIREWFGHYLKGEPAPKWITEGKKHLDREEELKALERERKTRKKDKSD